MTEGFNSKLRSRMRRDYIDMRSYRENRGVAVREAAGSRFTDSGAPKEVVVNFLSVMTDVLSLYLMGGCPQAMLDTRKAGRKPFAYKLELALNTLVAKKINFARTARRIVLDAIFGMGIIKKGLNSSSVEIGGIWHDVGQPFADSVDLDNFVLDTSAWVLEDCQYMADRYRLRKADAQACGLYDPALIAALPAAMQRTANLDGSESVKGISSQRSGDLEDLEDFVWLWDVYLPQSGRMLSFADEGDTQLRPDDMTGWNGPEGGPYDLLGYGEVPLSVLPKPPVADVMHLHEHLNSMARKIRNQTMRQKTIALYQKGSDDDAALVKKAKDGEMIGVNNPAEGGVREMSFGGPSQALLTTLHQFMALFNYIGYNVEGLAGMRPQAGTYGQEQLMTAGATRRMATMAERTSEFFTRQLRDLAWYLWTDPYIELPLTKRVPGTNITVQTKWTPEDREGDFLDYDIEVVPYSMRPRDPDTIYQATMRLFNEVVMPLVPIMQASGITIDAERLLDRMGRLQHIDMSDLVVTATGQMESNEPPTSEGPQKAANTRREYVRRNVSEATPMGMAQQMAQNMPAGAGAESGFKP